MRINKFLVLIVLMMATTIAEARKPAVEDFVGVETSGYKETPKGTEVLFDFGNKLQVTPAQETPYTDRFDINSFSTLSLLAFVALPFLMWFGVSQSMKKHHESTLAESIELQELDTTIENLDDYRKSDDDDDDKIAS